MRSTAALRFKEDFVRFPVEARQSIEKAMTAHLEPLKDDIAKQDEALQKEIVDLKEKLVKANEHRLRSEVDINELNDQIRNQRVLEDVKRKELELMMFDKRNRYQGGAKNRTEIPDTVPKRFEFPQMPRNYEMRLKRKIENQTIKEAPMLYGKTEFVRVPRGTAATNDRFGDPLWADMLIDRRRAENAEFYAAEKLGVPLSDKFPSINDDYTNKQGLVVPRFAADRIDDDRHILDVYSNNEERLKALEIYDKPDPRFASNFTSNRQGRVNFDKVDKIIDALDTFKDKYFEDKQKLSVYAGPESNDNSQRYFIIT